MTHILILNNLIRLCFGFWTTNFECNTFLSFDNSHCVSAFEYLFFVTLTGLKLGLGLAL